MTAFRLIIALAAPCALGACADNPTLQAVADAWSLQAVEEATDPVRAAMGMSALAAQVCHLSVDDWDEALDEGVEVSQEIRDWFTVEEEPQVSGDSARASYEVILGGGTFFGEDIGVRLVVVTPMEAFHVYLGEGGALGDPIATAALQVEGCQEGPPRVEGSVSFTMAGLTSHSVTLPGRDAEEDLLFATGAVIPEGSNLSWSGRLAPGRLRIDTWDAETIEGDTWPATVTGPDWSADVGVPLYPE